MKSAVNQIAKTVQWLETCKKRSSEEGPDATEKRHGGSWVSHVPSQGKCRYVFTRILSGLRWPGQTVMGSWPPAIIMQN